MALPSHVTGTIGASATLALPATTSVPLLAASPMPTVPSVFVENKFPRSIYTALDVCNGLTALALAISLAALAVQLARKDQRRLVKRTTRPEGTYILPHSPVLAPVMVACYCIVGIAMSIVLKGFIFKVAGVAVTQRLSLLLPMPLLLWAWLSAFANTFAWHLTPTPENRALRILRFKPRTLNFICWLTPMAIFAVQLALANLWPVRHAAAKAATLHYDSLRKTLDPDSAELEAARQVGLRLMRVAEHYYQGMWAIWAFAYGGSWVIYSTYSILLLRQLGQQAALTQTFMSASPNLSTSLTAKPSYTEKSQTSPILPRSRSFRRASEKLMQAGNVKSSQISKRELLKRNTRLVALELVSFSIFTLAWCFLAIVKAALGYRILTNYKTGPITVVGELYESTIFSLVAVTLLLFRGINILRNRNGEKIQHKSEDGLESRRQSMSNDIATRRGREGLSISLNVGDYIIVTNSIPTTPAAAALGAHTAYSIGLPAASPDDSYGSTSLIEEEPEKPCTTSGVRRKSSVTFTDGVQGGGEVVAVPALAFIAASPVVSPSAHMSSIGLGRAPSQSAFA